MTASSRINSDTDLSRIGETCGNITVEGVDLLVNERNIDWQTHTHHNDVQCKIHSSLMFLVTKIMNHQCYQYVLDWGNYYDNSNIKFADTLCKYSQNGWLGGDKGLNFGFDQSLDYYCKKFVGQIFWFPSSVLHLEAEGVGRL